MVRTVLILERNTKKELREAIKRNILDPKNNMRLITCALMKEDDGHYEAWCIVEVPENKSQLWGYAERMGLTTS